MKVAPTAVSVHDLKEVLDTLTRDPRRVHIRFRTLGQLWYPNFLQVVRMEEDKRILFHDETRKFFISLRDLSTITEFELDAPIDPFDAHTQYQVSENDLQMSRNGSLARSAVSRRTG